MKNYRTQIPPDTRLAQGLFLTVGMIVVLAIGAGLGYALCKAVLWAAGG